MSAERDAALAASLFAVDPVGTGGVCLRSRVHPARDQWLRLLREMLPSEAPMRRVPFNIADARLLGGLDLVATLRANRPVAERGALAMSHGGVVIVTMAERLTMHTAACLNHVLDTGEVSMSREGVSIQHSARVGLVALDEGMSVDEFVPACLRDRLAFLLDMSDFSMRTQLAPLYSMQQIQRARLALPAVHSNDVVIRAICAAAQALGAGSTRVSLLALCVARAAAALDSRLELTQEDAVIAARLVLAPRATVVPDAQAEPEPEPEPEAAPEAGREDQSHSHPASQSDTSDANLELDAHELEDRVLAAAAAAIPSGLLAQLREAANHGSMRSGGAGQTGAVRSSRSRGRPAGVRSRPPPTARLNLLETLRAAVPWQRMRGRTANSAAKLQIRAEDFRSTRHQQRAQTLTIFAVDASGSSALNRLAEAKGAVELLLVDCYVRRDQVAVIQFRGLAAQVLLPPTRSLVRAKRSLASLPGGGATPLAAAIEAAFLLAIQAQRRGDTPTIVMLTDGRANVARSRATGREAAHADALQAAGAIRAAGIAALFIDTSPRPNVSAREVAVRMNARYIALPFASAQAVSQIVRASAPRTAGKSQ